MDNSLAEKFIVTHIVIPPLPKGRGVYCFTSVRPSVLSSKIFFVAFFSVTVDRLISLFPKHNKKFN
jgi:hypothetical protein